MLSFFFNINWEHFVRRYPRYWQLLGLRQRSGGQANLFSDAYYRDLAAWFNLAWIDRSILESDQTLRGLVQKERGFTNEDMRAIVAKQREIIGRIVPLYRKLEDKGQVELTTSPYYHPILPLLIDTHSALESCPDSPLPRMPFVHPEDAAEQLRRAMNAHEEYFGRRPRGMWPSEGAVSQGLLPYLAKLDGLRWIATDEGILARSLNTPIKRDGYAHVTNPEVLYQPYRLELDGLATNHRASPDLRIVFRDIVLSDRIGFVYKHMESSEAVDDLINRLQRIRHNLRGQASPHLVSVILDGENCWEEYEDNGNPFLHELYERLGQDPDLQPVTVSEYLDQHPARQTIPRLFAGSWNNHNLQTWVGEHAQNRAWEYLAHTRQWLLAWQRENPLADWQTLEKAWEEVYIAEGSDWFWWYYSSNNPVSEDMFDREFRQHLRNVYHIAGVPSPSWLDAPILIAPSDERQRLISAYVTPQLTAGKGTEQWQGAGYVEPETSTGAMQRSQAGIRRLYYGYDRANLYLRIESDQDLSEFFVGIYVCLPEGQKANHRPRYADASVGIQLPSLSFHKEIAFRGRTEPVILSRAAGQEVWEREMPLLARVTANVGEVRVPLSALGVEFGDPLGLVLIAAKEGVIAEVLPSSGEITFALEELA